MSCPETVVALLQCVCKAYRLVNVLWGTLHKLPEVERLRVLLTTNQTWFLSEANSILQDATKATPRQAHPKARLSMSNRPGQPQPQPEAGLRKILGRYYQSYAISLNGIKTVLVELGQFLQQAHHTTVISPQPAVDEYRWRLASLREGNRALTAIRKFATGLIVPRNITSAEHKAIPEDQKLVQAAQRALYNATASIKPMGFYKSDGYQKACLIITRGPCVGVTVTLVLSDLKDSAPPVKISFHLDSYMLKHGENYLRGPYRYVLLEVSKSNEALGSVGASEVDELLSLSTQEDGKEIKSLLAFSLNQSTGDICQSLNLEDYKFPGSFVLEGLSNHIGAQNQTNIDPSTATIDGAHVVEIGTVLTAPRREGVSIANLRIPDLLGLPPAKTPKYGIGDIQKQHANRTKITKRPCSYTTNFSTLMAHLATVSGAFPIQHQFRLAYNLAKLLLEFYSSPWLEEDWNIRDIAVLHDLNTCSITEYTSLEPTLINLRVQWANGKLSASSLHKTSQLGNLNEKLSGPTPGIQPSFRPFYHLGIALLEVAYLKPLAFIPSEKFQKILVWQNPLGQKYQQVIERCLQGDLGVGPNPTVPEIRDAAYTHVVCVLRDMMNFMSQ